MSRRNNHNVSMLLVTLLVAVMANFCLIAVQAQPQTIFAAVKADDGAAIRKAIEEGADINQIGSGGQTPLVNAVLMGKPTAVETLLELQADVTIPEKDGYTVMHAAGFQGRAAILKLLAAHKDSNGESIDPMTPHKDGFYPLHRACWGRDLRHAETVGVFLELGVPVDLVAPDGKTCKEMTRNEETMAVLLQAVDHSQSNEESQAKAKGADSSSGDDEL